MVIAETSDGGPFAFLRYLGVPHLTFDAVLTATRSKPLSKNGCAEIVAFSIRNAATGGLAKNAAKAPIWFGAGEAQSLTTLARSGNALSNDFIQQLNAAGVTSDELARFVRIAVGDAINTLVPGVATGAISPSILATDPAAMAAPMSTSSPVEYDPLLAGSLPVSPFMTLTQRPELETKFLPAWRGAEQYVAQVLQSHGYTVEDRSRQNLGYDLYAAKDNRKYYIEVKLLDYTGQPFVITPNEEAVARECGECYALALTLRGKNGVHIQFVHDPVAKLKFVRQCRQWVWECSEYEFVSQFFGGEV
jgi:hypothetical protein